MRNWLLTVLFCVVVLTTACGTDSAVSSAATNDSPGAFGVLVMAHGGGPSWNGEVIAALQTLRDQGTMVETAFGMADAQSIQSAVQKLEEQGATRIGVVRLFISGESWYERTEKILGIRAGAMPRMTTNDHASAAGGPGHSMALWSIETEASFALSTQGLAEDPSMGMILADRVQALSHDPQHEDVLILAHGPGDDAENERWIALIQARAETVSNRLPVRRIEVQTLREDWPEKRKAAEQRIRRFVTRAQDEGGTAIVIPFRVQGFGPYAGVLSGLDYVSDGQGLLPHANVTQWIANQAATLESGSFQPAH